MKYRWQIQIRPGLYRLIKTDRDLPDLELEELEDWLFREAMDEVNAFMKEEEKP